MASHQYLASLAATLDRPITMRCGDLQRIVKTHQDVVTAARELLMKQRDGYLRLSRAGEEGWELARKTALLQVAQAVPSDGPKHPLIAFVGFTPTAVDAARGRGLSGVVGKTFDRDYLQPLGLTRDEVLVTHVAPRAVGKGASPQAIALLYRGWVDRELDRFNAPLIVALGKAAKNALGSRATVMLPHPGSHAPVQKSDRGEVARKLRALSARLAGLRKGHVSVKIGKSAPEKQIVYGAALDPYQFDSQDDWVPPWEVEQTAHDYLQKSRVINLQHEEPARAQVVESWLVHYPSDDDYRAAMQNEPHSVYDMPIGNQEVHSGTWMLGVHIEDPDVWQAVKAGSITAFSIGGTGYRTDVDRNTAMPSVTHIKP